MTRWTDAPIVGGSYSDDTRPFSVQDTVNYMVVYAEKDGTRSPKMLRGVPGFSEVADTGSAAPIRGMSNVEGLLLVVAGRTLYRVDTKYDCHVIGTIPGVGRVSMAHNQVTGGNQVAIANGLGGYVYDTRDGTLAQITDEGFPGAVSFNYLDSYILGLEPGRRFAFTSELADALSYNTLDQYEAESSPDALVGHAVNHREWWLMGERTIEIFANTGAETGTFQRTTGSGIEVGLASAFAKANLDNSLFWLGSDGVVYRANGYTPQRISTFPIEQAISRCNTKTAFAFTFEDKGHKVFYLTFQDGHTWGYDVASQEWHRRQSKGLDRWRINDLVKWNGRWIAGDYTNGKLYALDWDVQDEAGQTLEKMRVTGVLSDQQNAVIVNAIALVIDTGQPPARYTKQVLTPTSVYKYKQVSSEDTNDYHDPAYDDSAWPSGPTPFCNEVPHPDGAGWPQVKGTNWDLNTKMWLRGKFHVDAPFALTFVVFVDNYVTMWINGVLYLSPDEGDTGEPYTHQVVVNASDLVAGQNSIAILGVDVGVYCYIACKMSGSV